MPKFTAVVASYHQGVLLASYQVVDHACQVEDHHVRQVVGHAFQEGGHSSLEVQVVLPCVVDLSSVAVQTQMPLVLEVA